MKTALVIGGFGTIGKELCVILRSEGYKVYATTRTPEMRMDGVITIPMDIKNEASVYNAVYDVISDSRRIDVLVNLAGYAQYGALETVEAYQVRNQFEANVFGMMRVIRFVLPHMRNQGFGTIVNVSSSAGIRGRECASVYYASKFAVEGLSESLWLELRPDIRVKIVEPPPPMASNGTGLQAPEAKSKVLPKE